jgi:hypothetical protein
MFIALRPLTFCRSFRSDMFIESHGTPSGALYFRDHLAYKHAAPLEQRQR